MRRGLLRVGLLLLAGVLVGPAGSRPAGAQARPKVPLFPTEVDLITVDAVVIDAQGLPVAGLTADDFIVKEDGQKVQITSFEAFFPPPRPEPPPAPPSVVASNEAGRRASGRAFVVLFDDEAINPGRSEQARQAIRSFVELALRGGDEVTVATTSGTAWWSTRLPEGGEDLQAVLGRLQGRDVPRASFERMTDYEAFRIHNYEDTPSMARGTPQGPAAGRPAQDRSSGIEAAIPAGAQARVKERVTERWGQIGFCNPASCDGMVRGRAAELDARRRTRMRATLDAVRRGLRVLAPASGRKTLLLVSEGFLSDPTMSEPRAVAAASREANAAVYFIDVRGLMAQPGFGSADEAGPPLDPSERETLALEESVLESEGSAGLAHDTGGFSVRNTNEFADGAERIGRESRVFYMLGFYPPVGKPPERWRRLEVSVRRPDLRVRARSGYMASARTDDVQHARDREAANRGPHPEVAQALDSPHDADGVPLRAMAYVFEPRRDGTARVFVAVEFDADRLAFEPVGRQRRAHLDVSLMARLRDSERGFRHDDRLELRLDEGETAGWRSHAREFGLPAGVAQVRVVARDATSGAMGSVSTRVEIPPPGALRLSTPILTDRLAADAGDGGRPQVAIAVHRAFAPDRELYCEFEVFGAARTASGESRVTAGLSLWARDGRLMRRAPASRIATDSDGRVVRLVGLGVRGLAEGPYDLVLEVEDQLGGTRLEHRESFTLASSLGTR